MAAKLKKRALAEYQSQTQVIDVSSAKSDELSNTEKVPQKKLKLVLTRSSVSTSSKTPEANPLLNINWNEASLGEISNVIVKFIYYFDTMSINEINECIKKLFSLLKTQNNEDFTGVRTQVCLALKSIISHDGKIEESKLLIRDTLSEWMNEIFEEKSLRVVSSILSVFSCLLENKIPIGRHLNEKIRELSFERLKTTYHILKINALRALSRCMPLIEEKQVSDKIIDVVSKFTICSDPRVKHAAFQTLLEIHQIPDKNKKLGIDLYNLFCKALNDDFDRVRLVALKLLFEMAQTYPDEKILLVNSYKKVQTPSSFSKSKREEKIRLVDDAFGKICNSINDLEVHVRELAAKLIGDMENVSQVFLEQTLSKQLMSNMRLKISDHDRNAKLVSSGEWSSGKKWADDAPKEKLDKDEINLMSFGACGAFIHGLEDEFLCVRSAAVESLTKLSIKNPKLAALALDFIVDMFNDEIEAVRLKAIESLRRISEHISLQVHQLETILSALDDYSLVVREKLHNMLQASTIATKDGLQNVIDKLLNNLKKYPQDRRSLLSTFKILGKRHPDLTLPLVTQLLEIHPFFDTAEPDIEDPSYLCILVLIFNAAEHSPTLPPLLDQHTKRHYHYLLDTYPHLMPEKDKINNQENKVNTENFLKQTLNRVKDSEGLLLSNRIKVLQRCKEDLKRLGTIDPDMSDSTKFIELYVQCQSLILSVLSSRFWLNPHSSSTQQIDMLETNIGDLFSFALQLKHRFVNLSENQMFKVRVLKINILALHILFLVRASNKSALSTTDNFLDEVDAINNDSSEEIISNCPFLYNLVKKLSEIDDLKPGMISRIVQPLLLSYPLQPMDFNPNIGLSKSTIFEPQGMNETPLKYAAGMILAVPVDCELLNIHDLNLVKVAIKTPDQKIQLVTPTESQIFSIDNNSNKHRLLTDALMSHSAWSEAMHVEISIVLDLSTIKENRRTKSSGKIDFGKNIIRISNAVKVYVLPRAIRRGI